MIDKKELNEHFDYIINKSNNISSEKIYEYLLLMSKKLNIKFNILFNEFVKNFESKIKN